MRRAVNMKVVTIVVFPIASFFGLFGCHRVCEKCKWAKIKSHFHIFLFLFLFSLFFAMCREVTILHSRILMHQIKHSFIAFSTTPQSNSMQRKKNRSGTSQTLSPASTAFLPTKNTKLSLYIFSFPRQITSNLGRSHQNTRRYSPCFLLLNNSNFSSPPRWP